MGKFRDRSQGIVIDCEGGYFAGDASGGALFDKQGNKIKDISDEAESKGLEVAHLSNFAAAVRSRKTEDLAAEPLQGYLSTSCCHMANISHRLGKQTSPEAIRVSIKASREFSDSFDRCAEYLRENGVDLGATEPTLGPWVTFDSKRQRFVKDFAAPANKLSKREYPKPYSVPRVA